MASRMLEISINSNTTVKSDTIPVVRSTGSTVLMFKFYLGAALSGSNTLTIKLYAVTGSEVGSSRTFVAEESVGVFPPIVLTETEISANPTKMVTIPNSYGNVCIEYTRAGAGANTFNFLVYRNP